MSNRHTRGHARAVVVCAFFALCFGTAGYATAQTVPIDFDDQQTLVRYVSVAVELSNAIATIQGSQHGMHESIQAPRNVPLQSAFLRLTHLYEFLPSERIKAIVAEFYAAGIEQHYGQDPPGSLGLTIQE